MPSITRDTPPTTDWEPLVDDRQPVGGVSALLLSVAFVVGFAVFLCSVGLIV